MRKWNGCFVGFVVFVFWGVSVQAQPLYNLNNLEPQNGVLIQGTTSTDNTGIAVNPAGDLNGDGHPDFTVVATNPNGPGKAFLIFGGDDCLPAVIDESFCDGTRGVLLRGITNGEDPVTGSGLGDVNGDGFDDYGWGGFHAPPNNTGRAYMVFGRPTPWPATINMSTLNGTDGVVFPGPVAAGLTGYGVSDLGDVNDDGLADFAISSPYIVDTNGTIGAVHVVFGSTNPWPASFNLNSLNGVNGFTFLPQSQGAYGTVRIEPVGDLTNDGVDDMLFNSSQQTVNTTNQMGEVYLLAGMAGAWPSIVTSASASTVFRGHQAGQTFGSSAFVTDFNGDGRKDVCIAAAFEDVGVLPNAGAGYVFFGSAAGFPPLVRSTDVNGSNGFSIKGVYNTGYFFFGPAGDFDADGYEDLQLSASWADTPGFDQGRYYMAFGDAGPYPASITTVQLTQQTRGWMFNGKSSNDRFGIHLNEAGDINGDGYTNIENYINALAD